MEVTEDGEGEVRGNTGEEHGVGVDECVKVQQKRFESIKS